MWKFNDPKRNIVFKKSDEKIVMEVTEMSQAKDVKNKTQNVANTLDYVFELFGCFLSWLMPVHLF